jgi:hypothetical protein
MSSYAGASLVEQNLGPNAIPNAVENIQHNQKNHLPSAVSTAQPSS